MTTLWLCFWVYFQETNRAMLSLFRQKCMKQWVKYHPKKRTWFKIKQEFQAVKLINCVANLNYDWYPALLHNKKSCLKIKYKCYICMHVFFCKLLEPLKMCFIYIEICFFLVSNCLESNMSFLSSNIKDKSKNIRGKIDGLQKIRDVDKYSQTWAKAKLQIKVILWIW